MVVINRSQLTRSKSDVVVLKALARANTKNHTGSVNFNANGEKDGKGLVQVGEKYIDSFVLQSDPTKAILSLGEQNKVIRLHLQLHGLDGCIVRGIKSNASECGQDFKISCASIHYDAVVRFLRENGIHEIGMRLKEVDLIADYAGVFDKEEVINYLVFNHAFREQASPRDMDDYATIISNDYTVGKNCLTVIGNTDGFSTRQRLYNKMVQILESEAVRKDVGCLWKEWVCENQTPLAAARDMSRARGLTRVRTSIELNQTNQYPREEVIEEVLEKVTKIIPKSLIYSTPFTEIWKTYCSALTHSLICVDKANDIALLVYSVNEYTRKISGHSIKNWSANRDWCLHKLTLNLPIDIIEVKQSKKVAVLCKRELKFKKDLELEITGHRFVKDTSTTRLISSRGLFGYNKASDNYRLLKNAGFEEHKNCIPYLTNKRNCEEKLGNVQFLDEIYVFYEKFKGEKKGGLGLLH